MTRKKQNRASVGFVALGCPKNMVDSEKMLAEIAQAEYPITAEPEDADVVVINTCGFIAPAKAEALEEIEHAVHCKRNGAVKKVIVAGCLPERLGKELFNQADGIDAIVGLGQREEIARIIKKTLASNGIAAYLDHSCRTIRGPVPDDRARLRIAPAHWAYLRISEGCNHHCSFCTIPAIRGRFRSKPQQLILAEAAELVSAGAVELNIIAQDTTYYGRDLKIKNALPVLLQELEKIPRLVWIRLMYSYPAGIDDQLIETIAASEKIVSYIDVPIQHINNKVLKDMHRPDTKERICSLVEKLRSAIPDIVLRTTLIIGFPGETDRQFNELLEFVKWAEFDALGCFEFYPESGTAAAEMPNQVPDQVKQRRFDELMLTQQKVAFAKNGERIGSRLTCLVDSVEAQSTGRARFYGQAPDIDSVCIVENCSASPGQFVGAKVTGTKDYDLIIEQIQC
ncbi:MAG: 30S ribosomal protein S12 methylthiotransferase RimO [Planctomycetota bacterium]|jgi:ribosomal protein S12 methylthiotransferase